MRLPFYRSGEPTWIRWIDRFNITLAVIGGVLTVALMLHIVLDVTARSVLNSPLHGTLDFTQFAWMPTLVSFGLGYALLRGEHIRVNLLSAGTRETTQRVVEIIGMVATFVTVLMLINFGVEKAIDAMELDERAVGTPILPIWISRWVIVVGLIGLLLQAVAQLVRAFTDEHFVPLDDDEAAHALAGEGFVDDVTPFPESARNQPHDSAESLAPAERSLPR